MTKIYTDIGINHGGSLDIAIELAKNFGRHVDAVKLQMRTPDICVPESTWQKRKKMPITGADVSYIEYKQLTELGHSELVDFSNVMKKNDIEWFASVWDIPSLRNYMGLKDKTLTIKIPSALCKNEELANEIKMFTVEGLIEPNVIVSLGDCEDVEEMENVYNRLWSGLGATMMYCLPCYGADVYCPNEIIEFRDTFERYDIPIGYSTHSGRLRDIEFAVSLGYDVVEYHCTFSKLMDGSDHSSSYTLAQAEQIRRHVEDIESRVRPDRSEFWESIDEKLSTLRPTRVL